MIMKYIYMRPEDLDNKIGNKIEKDMVYNSAFEEFTETIKKLDTEIWLKIESNVACMEAIARDIAYDEGFKEGVKFIMGCLTGEPSADLKGVNVL